jgi:hypothetical protein
VLIDTQKGRTGKRQKGFTEYLLCNDCEEKFNAWETYFAKVWFNPPTTLRPAVISEDLAIVRNLDYAKFKLFHLSLVWRSGISRVSLFDAVRLGGQEPKLRKRLIANDPGLPTEYPFFGIALRDQKTGGFKNDVVRAPHAARIWGYWVYTIIFGGVVWHYYVSGHRQVQHVPVYFGLDGTLILAVQNWTDNLQMQAFTLDAYLSVLKG